MRHGRRTDYEQGCRCESAREARRVYMKRRREGRGAYRAPVDGVSLKLRALQRIGWPTSEVARRAGINVWIIREVQAQRRRRVNGTTEQAINRAYEALSGTPGPSERVRAQAERKGWLPPLELTPVDDAPEEVDWTATDSLHLDWDAIRGRTKATWEAHLKARQRARGRK